MIYLDVQHTGQARKPKSMGASIGDRMDQQEAYWTSLYAFFCEMRLRELGHKVIRISDGNYRARHERVNWYEDNYPQDKSVYLSCHINAGGGGYSSFFYDSRSTKGGQLAQCIADVVCDLPHLSTVKCIGARKGDWTKNAFATIAGVQPVAICAEPFFIDNETHQHYLSIDQIKLLGQAMAEGIDLWYNSN